MSAMNTPVRPSMAYKDGTGKPVVAKRWDDIVQAYRWDVVFPTCNNAGRWIPGVEGAMVHKAWLWCFWMNSKLASAAHQARAALTEQQEQSK